MNYELLWEQLLNSEMQDIMQMQTENISFPNILDPLEWSSGA